MHLLFPDEAETGVTICTKDRAAPLLTQEEGRPCKGGVYTERTGNLYQTYTAILERELVCAMGCTEPIAIAYCAAVARAQLGRLPDRIKVEASGNIIKNVKSVVVPNTNGGRGMETAAAIGVLAGDESAQLEVISHVSPQALAQLPGYLAATPISVSPARSDHLLDITVTVYAGTSYARVRTVDEHTNIVHIERDGQMIQSKDAAADRPRVSDVPDYELLSVEGIVDFADTCCLEDVAPILERQISLNMAIAQEGLDHPYGANIGKVLLAGGPDSVRLRAKAYAAAGSDARMNGCELPVVINSGSGNQGLSMRSPALAACPPTAVQSALEPALERGSPISTAAGSMRSLTPSSTPWRSPPG